MTFKSVNDIPDSVDLKDKRVLGRVMDNMDPLMLERIRVSIPGLMEGTPDVLPWIPRKGMKTIAGSTAKTGSFGLVPAVGVDVYVEFDQGSAQHPEYTGLPIQEGEVPDESKVNYPNRYGHRDPLGNVMFVDTTPGASTVLFLQTVGGVTITFDNAGNLIIVSTGNLQATIQGNLQASVHGNTNIATQGSTVISTQGSTDISSVGVCAIHSDSDMGITTSGNLGITANGNLAITANGISNIHSTGSLNFTADGGVNLG